MGVPGWKFVTTNPLKICFNQYHQYGISALIPTTTFCGEPLLGLTNVSCLLRRSITLCYSMIELTMSSGLLTAAPVGLATEAVDTTLPGTVAWTAALSYGDCDALL